MTESVVELKGVTKYYGDLQVTNKVDLSIRRGEFLTLLGPSGCGKTTTLRMIAGFEQPSEGTIMIDGVDQTGCPPYERQVNTVFQHFALFPHMTVQQNVAYGLSIRRVPNREIQERVQQALGQVQLSGHEHKFPSQLSGGQKQRVALARALILRPQVLLLDEPLGALDFKLRKEMQIELKSLQRRLNVTFVLVTHDQEEALVLSDRIAVMYRGKIEQLDTAAAVYERPQTPFVADFLGFTNFVPGVARSSTADAMRVETMVGATVSLPASACIRTGDPVTVAVRPERLQIEPGGETSSTDLMVGNLEETIYIGSGVKYLVRLEHGLRLTAFVPCPLPDRLAGLSRGCRVTLGFNSNHAVALPAGGTP